MSENFNSSIGETNVQEKISRKIFARALIFFALVFLFTFGFYLGVERGREEKRSAISNLDFEEIFGTDKNFDTKLFKNVWELLEEKYVDSDKLDNKELFYGAIRGMLEATGDPYTDFFNQEERKEFDEEMEGSFEGLGVEVGIKEKMLTVIAPLEDTPAAKAGLRAGDKIVKIDDVIAADLSIDEAVKKMRGPKGTEVKLTIFRDGMENTQEIPIKRETINIKSVKFEERENNVAYIKVSRFGQETSAEFQKAAMQAFRKSASKIVLDLRNNPGGYVDSAVEIASKFLPKGEIILLEEDQNRKRTEKKSLGGNVLGKIPVVVLINEGSASASEILAGALKENRQDVVLVGGKSFGKGSEQEFIDLPGGTAVKITVARWLTPKGNQIDNDGIKPDVEVEFTEENYIKGEDPQLERALEIDPLNKE